MVDRVDSITIALEFGEDSILAISFESVIMKIVVRFFALMLLGAGVWSQALAQLPSTDWPMRAVKIVVPYPPGGGVDLLARAVAQKLSDRWQQPVTIENRPGANTLIGTEAVARSSDGHTLLLTTDATFTINPHIYSKLPYDVEKDFAPLLQMVAFSQLLVANAALPVNSLKELIALARAKPGSLSYASYGSGSQPQLAMEMFKQKAGLFVLHIPYRGIPQAVAAVVGGEVPLTWSGIPSARPHISSQRIKALAYGGKARAPAYPEVPTMTELGFPEVDANVWVGLFAPSAAPISVQSKIQRDVLAILREPEFRSREVDGKGYELVGAGAAEFARHIRSELAARAAPIKYSGAKVD
jgi:tripartite-type tricarboxylate transporter receptor subunit TctC